MLEPLLMTFMIKPLFPTKSNWLISLLKMLVPLLMTFMIRPLFTTKKNKDIKDKTDQLKFILRVLTKYHQLMVTLKLAITPLMMSRLSSQCLFFNSHSTHDRQKLLQLQRLKFQQLSNQKLQMFLEILTMGKLLSAVLSLNAESERLERRTVATASAHLSYVSSLQSFCLLTTKIGNGLGNDIRSLPFTFL